MENRCRRRRKRDAVSLRIIHRSVLCHVFSRLLLEILPHLSHDLFHLRALLNRRIHSEELFLCPPIVLHACLMVFPSIQVRYKSEGYYICGTEGVDLSQGEGRARREGSLCYPHSRIHISSRKEAYFSRSE